MPDSIRNYQVRDNDFRGVDIYVSILNRDRELTSLLRLQFHPVCQRGTVCGEPWDDIVLEIGFQLVGSGVFCKLCRICKRLRGIGHEVRDIRQVEDLVHVGCAGAKVVIDVQDGNEI